jgi:hypothetical protein
MTGPRPRRGFDWDGAGRELGGSLDGYHAVVVIGADPVVTGRVAVAAARVQAVKRRVAVGDLFAESPPIQDLVEAEDPHGLVDSFTYGVSLSKIAHPVRDAGELFVMPSGTEPPAYDEILPNPRWHRLAAGFREVGALLILAAPANAPQIEKLVAATDGAVLVGEVVPRQLPVSAVITTVRETRPDVPVPDAETPAPVSPAPVAPRWSKRRVAAVAGVALTVALAAAAAWLAYRPLADESRRLGGRPDTAGAARPFRAVHLDSARDTSAAVIPVTPPILNPQDSATAAAFAVELMAANTQAGAILKLQQDGKNLPAATFSPVLIQGARWYKVIAGASATEADADTLLADLRRRKVLDAGSGTVVRVPLAFLIDSVPPTAVAAMIATYVDRGQPLYALRQDNGMVWLLLGAFETVEQSLLYAESLRASEVTPVLVYRKGRSF